MTVDGPTNLFTELQHPSITQAIVQQIHSVILQGRLKPGERITEQAIAKQMGVSRPAVREALQELRVLGVLIGRRRKTYVAPAPSGQEIHDIYTLRGICEGIAVVDARRRLRKDDFEQLESFVRAMEQSARSGDYWRFLKADLSYHELLWRANGNGHLLRILQFLTYPYFAYMAAYVHRSKLATLSHIAREHRKYFNDLRRLTGTKLKTRVERHFRGLAGTVQLLCRKVEERSSAEARLRKG